MSERAPAFGDLGDFAPRKPSSRPDPRVIDEVAESQGFPSRAPRSKSEESEAAPPPARRARRHTTGRNQQLNIKASAETVALMYSIADDLQQPLGAVLELALKALARERSAGEPNLG